MHSAVLCRAGAARGSGALRAQDSLCLLLPQFSAIRFSAHIPAGMSLGCAFPGTPFFPMAQRQGGFAQETPDFMPLLCGSGEE